MLLGNHPISSANGCKKKKQDCPLKVSYDCAGNDFPEHKQNLSFFKRDEKVQISKRQEWEKSLNVPLTAAVGRARHRQSLKPTALGGCLLLLEWETKHGQFQSLQLRMMDFSALSNAPSLQFKQRKQQNASQSTLTQSVILSFPTSTVCWEQIQ